MDRNYVPLCTFKEDYYVPVSKMNKTVIKRVVYDLLRVSSYHVLHLKRNVMSTKKEKKRENRHVHEFSETVWPSGKALGW